WRSKKNKAGLVIITRSEFFSALEPLKALRENQGLRVQMVDIADIFDEFSDGERTPQAVRDFLRTATTTWKRKPAFVLFAGHASLDPRNHLGFGDSDIVPTRLIDTGLMETASDDWFVDFNDDGLPELAVGRLPFRTQSEAVTMVSKILSYEQSGPASEALLVADANDGFDFEAASGQVRDILPASLKVNRIDRGRVDAAAAKTALIDAINRGQKIVNYMGHGSVNLWKGNLLTNDDARGLTNSDHLSLFVMMTCLNGYFQDAALDSLAESLLKAEHGGAVAVWASSGMTGPGEQAPINQQLYLSLFEPGVKKGQALRLGEAIMRAKAATGDLDVRRTWVLLGDPSMRIK
ncbi:MAG TPA: C25 family cysteine peptidase, partial [Blastocatellia bacterium]|nr:C25 family cysteine peptidase [Blastocatellia bacterium]